MAITISQETISQETYERLTDPSKRDPAIEKARLETLAKVRALRARKPLITARVAPPCSHD